MSKAENKQLIRLMQEQIYEEMRDEFRSMGTGGHYTREQKSFVLNKIVEYGVRAIARILEVPRRTLQRWCRAYDVFVKRCPDWVYEWAERRRERIERLKQNIQMSPLKKQYGEYDNVIMTVNNSKSI